MSWFVLGGVHEKAAQGENLGQWQKGTQPEKVVGTKERGLPVSGVVTAGGET